MVWPQFQPAFSHPSGGPDLLRCDCCCLETRANCLLSLWKSLVCSQGTFGWKAGAAGFTGRSVLVLWKLEVYQGVADLHPVMIALEDKFEDDNQTSEHICQKFSV